MVDLGLFNQEFKLEFDPVKQPETQNPKPKPRTSTPPPKKIKTNPELTAPTPKISRKQSHAGKLR
jgi:hypothetical protein